MQTCHRLVSFLCQLFSRPAFSQKIWSWNAPERIQQPFQTGDPDPTRCCKKHRECMLPHVWLSVCSRLTVTCLINWSCLPTAAAGAAVTATVEDDLVNMCIQGWLVFIFFYPSSSIASPTTRWLDRSKFSGKKPTFPAIPFPLSLSFQIKCRKKRGQNLFGTNVCFVSLPVFHVVESKGERGKKGRRSFEEETTNWSC